MAKAEKSPSNIFFSVRIEPGSKRERMLNALKEVEDRGNANLLDQLLKEACDKRGIDIDKPAKKKP